jgi:LysM repeat protein
MTDSRRGARRPADRDAGPAGPARTDARSAVLDICPYLRSDAGSWRSVQPSRDHRCHAVNPPAALATTKQRSLCLQPAHASCATYRAAQAAAAETHPRATVDSGGLWPATRSTLLVLDPAGATHVAPLGAPRMGSGGTRVSPAQAAVVGVLVVAIVAVVGLRSMLGFGDAGGPQASTAVQPTASAISSPTDSAFPTAEPTAIPSPTLLPTAEPTAIPSPTPKLTATPLPSGGTYVVKKGDSLSSIASIYQITWQSIAAANNIKAPYSLHVGQVLIIPTP